MKKSEINKLDKIFSQLIRSRAYCEMCGNFNTLQTAHFISRKYQNLRWSPENCYCLCAKCHRLVHDYPKAWDKLVSPDKSKVLWAKANKIQKNFYEDVLRGLNG